LMLLQFCQKSFHFNSFIFGRGPETLLDFFAIPLASFLIPWRGMVPILPTSLPNDLQTQAQRADHSFGEGPEPLGFHLPLNCL
jgi:hypothetical protein